MWVLTSLGFFSIVRKPDDVGAGTLTVRARVRADLVALRDAALPTLGAIVSSPDADYRYRARAPQADVAAALARLAAALDYANFKDEVARCQGQARAELYEHVWGALHALQRNPGFDVR